MSVALTRIPLIVVCNTYSFLPITSVFTEPDLVILEIEVLHSSKILEQTLYYIG